MTAGKVKISSRNLNIHGTQDQSTAARLSKIFYQTWRALLTEIFLRCSLEIFIDFTMWALIVMAKYSDQHAAALCQKNIYNWCVLAVQFGLSCFSIFLLPRLIKSVSVERYLWYFTCQQTRLLGGIFIIYKICVKSAKNKWKSLNKNINNVAELERGQWAGHCTLYSLRQLTLLVSVGSRRREDRCGGQSSNE